MRILILHSTYLSGPASGENRVVEDETKLLRDGGHQVEVFSPTPETDRPGSRARLGMRAIWSNDAAHSIKRKLKAFRPEVVHVHNVFPMLSPLSLQVAGSEGAAVVMTLHNYRLLCLPAVFLRDGKVCEDCLGKVPWRGIVHKCYQDSVGGSAALATSLTLHRAIGSFDAVTLYLAASAFLRDKYIEGGFAPDRLWVKPNFAWETSRRRGPGDYFLFLGRLSFEKGLDTLLESWRDPPGRLVVVGDGPDSDRLQHEAPPQVEFRGLVSADEMPAIVMKARAVLVPSLSYEAASRAIIEAYAAGVPVLASRIGAIPEVVSDEVSGLLLPPGDPAAWRTAARRLLDDEESERMGGGGAALWAEKFGPETALQRLEEAYSVAIDLKRSSRHEPPGRFRRSRTSRTKSDER